MTYNEEISANVSNSPMSIVINVLAVGESHSPVPQNILQAPQSLSQPSLSPLFPSCSSFFSILCAYCPKKPVTSLANEESFHLVDD